MKQIKLLLVLSLLYVSGGAEARSLKGARLAFHYSDTVFQKPYIDVDRSVSKPVRCRYIHGGFADGTKFSFYFPEKKDYKGRFFQYITPFPDSETAAQHFPASINPITFSILHGSYFVETNEGGRLDFTNEKTKRPDDIGAYRANAACAEFSRVVAKRIYGCSRPYGYCYGGSGGAYRTTGSMESTSGVWDGAVPYVLGSPQAIPMVFSVRMNALRILRDKLDDIVDALEPGGSGDPYSTLTVQQRQMLLEATRMGFPIHSWYGYKYMDIHGFLVLYQSVVQMDPSYFHHDFWETPGYEGYDKEPTLMRDLVRQKAVVKRIIGQTEAEHLGLVKRLSEEERGSADRAWESIGSEIKDKPVAYELDVTLRDIGMGGDVIVLNGQGRGVRLQASKTSGAYVALAPVNASEKLALLHVGDSVQVDNSDFLAVLYYYRHTVPSPDYYVWNQFRDFRGMPVYPQRPKYLGPLFTMGAAGCIPDGNIKGNGKMILLCSVWDREAFAWQGDWYRSRVKHHLGDKTDSQFRLWYTDRALHADGLVDDDPTESVSYLSTLYQALLDVSDWVEKGISPSSTTQYSIKDGQVILDNHGYSRGGLQPVPTARVNGKGRAEVGVGKPVTIDVAVDVPKGTGRIVKAEWCLDSSKEYTLQQDLSKAKWNADGSHVEFSATVRYDKPGTYFPTVRVYSQRNGDARETFTMIPNLSKVRIIVR
jgi:hypothetical protein